MLCPCSACSGCRIHRPPGRARVAGLKNWQVAQARAGGGGAAPSRAKASSRESRPAAISSRISDNPSGQFNCSTVSIHQPRLYATICIHSASCLLRFILSVPGSVDEDSVGRVYQRCGVADITIAPGYGFAGDDDPSLGGAGPDGGSDPADGPGIFGLDVLPTIAYLEIHPRSSIKAR